MKLYLQGNNLAKNGKAADNQRISAPVEANKRIVKILVCTYSINP